MKSFRPKINQNMPVPQNGGNQLRPNQPQNQQSQQPNFKQYKPNIVENFKQKAGQVFQKNNNGLRVIPLGGVGLVQKNMFVYEYGDDIIIIDCGVGFPDGSMLGIDLIIPDISYLKDKKHKIKGIIITHAHEDHIGGLPYIWPELNVPIYSQKLTCGFIRNKFADHKLPKDAIKTVGIDDVLKLGQFTVSFYQVSHSVPDSTGIIIQTPMGTTIHQSDFKVDWTPVNGQRTDVAKVAQLGAAGVEFMTIDCLGAQKPGFTPSEMAIEDTFERIEKNTIGKLLITLMTSNITRIQQALNVAERSGRKVAIVGRSMENNFQVSRDLGYLDIPPNLIINQEAIRTLPPEKLMIIIAGSLGQSGSALARAAHGDHKFVTIGKQDTVVFSADPMPSAVVAQGELLDILSKIGCQLFASTITPELHVSGHAASEELKMMINLIRPKYLMPIGGEYRMMKSFAELAKKMGYQENQILLPDEGEIIDINKGGAKINGNIPTQNVYVDGLGVGDVGSVVLKDRQVMSAEGVVVVIVAADRQGRVVGEPDVISRGFIFEKDSDDLIEAAKEIVKSSLTEKGGGLDWRYSRDQIEHFLQKFFYEETKRSPLILPLVIQV